MILQTDFRWTMRVYYEDTDSGGVVYYANYLKFFERARTEWLRAAGIGQHAMVEQEQAMFVVRSTSVEYHKPAKLDDELVITVRVEKMGRASMVFVQEAWRGQHCLSFGRIKVACVHATQFRPCPIPASVMSAIHAHYSLPIN